jgi:2-hydroxychromene-2-carboxylate isomerase
MPPARHLRSDRRSRGPARPGSHFRPSVDHRRSILGRAAPNIVAMTASIDIYYDFRSPYAYLAWWRIRRQRALSLWKWRWKPVSIDVLLNLQAGREPLAPYVDPLPPPKRKHFLADIRRSANFFGAPLSPLHQPRPDPAPALCVALRLAQDGIPHDRFIDMVFEAMWQHRRDIGTREVLTNCLISASLGEALIESAVSPGTRSELVAQSMQAYEMGIFGVPSFVAHGEIFFGADRLDMLAWRLEQQSNPSTSQGAMESG